MLILMHLQLSRTLNGKYLLSADSNFNFMKHICNILAELGHEIHLLIPTASKRIENEEDIYKELNTNIKLLYIDCTTDVFESRFLFNKGLAEIVFKNQYDIIWCNDPCLSLNFKVFSKGKSKIITYMHWMDSPSNKVTPDWLTYSYRQFEAVIISDYYLFNSNFAQEFFLKDFAKVFNEHPKIDKLRVLQPIAINYNLNIKYDKINILFNHRLSSLPQYRNNFISFLNFVEKIREFNKNINITVLNPDKKQINENIQKIAYPTTHKEYIDILEKHNTSVSFFTYPGMWSMSIADVIMQKYNVFYLSHSGYAELLPSLSYSQQPTPTRLLNYFKKLLADPKYFVEDNIENYKYANNTYSIKATAQKLKLLLEEIEC